MRKRSLPLFLVTIMLLMSVGCGENLALFVPKIKPDPYESLSLLDYTEDDFDSSEASGGWPGGKTQNGSGSSQSSGGEAPSGGGNLSNIPAEYMFNGSVSRKVLENYLSRTITYSVFGSGTSNRGLFLDADDIYTLIDMGAKYIQRAGCVWIQSATELSESTKSNYKYSIDSVHVLHPEIVFEACLFETCSQNINAVVIPPYVLEAFGQPVETGRRFDYRNIIYLDWEVNRWGANTGVPDISKIEAQMYFYYMATFYIDAGFEAFHWGQVELMGKNDYDNSAWTKVINMARAYASTHARRGFIFNNAHSFREAYAIGSDGLLVYDFHASPVRCQEVPSSPMDCVIQKQSDSIYGKSTGGKTHSGWECDRLPFLVEIDNYGGVYQEDITNVGKIGVNPIWPWGFDEISWFSNQSDARRRDWLAYAYKRVRELDSCGFFSMPGLRPFTQVRNGALFSTRYNCLSVPFNDSAAIKAIWAANS